MINMPKIDLQPYLDMIWRRKWWMAIPLVLSLLVGGIYLAVTPKTYEASTLILVESQRIPQSYVKTTVSQGVSSRLRTISQQIYSRTNLEKIIEEFNLLSQKKTDDQTFMARVKKKIANLLGRQSAVPSKDEKLISTMGMVESLRKKIKIVLGGSGKQEAFTISAEWQDPELAASVANAIASQFIEENLKVREEMAIGTTKFLERETNKYKTALEVKEKEVEKFKLRNMGMLPEQLQTNLDILKQLSEELNSLEQRREQDRQQALMMQRQAGAMQASQAYDASDLFAAENPADMLDESSGRLDELESQLKALKMRYTDNHPDVIYLQRIIQKLKDEQKNSEADVGEVDAGEELAGVDNFSPDMMLKEQMDQINLNVKNYDKKIAAIKKKIAIYQQRIEKTNQVSLELTMLTRDYETMKDRYQDLLKRKLDAQMAQEMEVRQKGEQFRVLDPAIAPNLPVKPDVGRTLLLALLFGLGAGFGLAYLRESIDPAFYTPEDLENFLQIKVMVSLPFDNSSPTLKVKHG